MLGFEAILKNKPALRARRKTVRKGRPLFAMDETAETAYLVREGILIVVCSSPNGREVITSVYFPGEICGGLSVLTDGTYMGSARAPKKTEAVVTPLSRSELTSLIVEDPDLYRRLVLTQREKQRFKDRMLLGMVAESCEQRAASALLWLHQKGAMRATTLSPSYLCRQELADLIGSTVETVIRVLSRFRKKGLMAERDGLVELNLDALTALAQAA
jgi:CRP/FNR family transcriptional regulator